MCSSPYFCPCESPESGEKVGLIKTLYISTALIENDNDFARDVMDRTLYKIPQRILFAEPCRNFTPIEQKVARGIRATSHTSLLPKRKEDKNPILELKKQQKEKKAALLAAQKQRRR